MTDTAESTTWTWKAVDPMASYLATVNVGEFDLDFYRDGGIRYADAIDPDLFEPLGVPTDGTQLAISQDADNAYKRLLHLIDVPAGGATVVVHDSRRHGADWDYAFVEAHTVGAGRLDDLEDLNGHTTQDTGFVCPIGRSSTRSSPRHYQTVDEETGECTPGARPASGGRDRPQRRPRAVGGRPR